MNEKTYNSLKKNEMTSTKELSERKNIITKANESAAVVIVAVKDYAKKLNNN